VTFSPGQSTGASHPHEWKLPASLGVARRAFARTGLTLPPRALHLETWQHSSKVVVVELFTTFFVSLRAGMQAPIVDKADTAERLSKHDSLLFSRIESILVCPLDLLAHCLCALSLFLDVFFHSCENFSVERAIVLFSNLFHLFQQMDGEPNGKSFPAVFHATIVTSNCNYIKQLWYPTQAPQTRNDALIPSTKDDDFPVLGSIKIMDSRFLLSPPHFELVQSRKHIWRGALLFGICMGMVLALAEAMGEGSLGPRFVVLATIFFRRFRRCRCLAGLCIPGKAYRAFSTRFQ
jgi:hypothetical protein